MEINMHKTTKWFMTVAIADDTVYINTNHANIINRFFITCSNVFSLLYPRRSSISNGSRMKRLRL